MTYIEELEQKRAEAYFLLHAQPWPEDQQKIFQKRYDDINAELQALILTKIEEKYGVPCSDK